ncbi:Uncharacterised protein [Nocardia otitidiscaviarum]|uniref:Uncharacterized protein n=1 Tax=Nocardia otitidiscaviarum TaxID=1823 RepID=A0A379JM91_9NOCA|nr:hypothetical protein [Nocardia otitidiscaviarum]SUD49618.1 Uncharacterised protein [Nocardia otitidiscaviarum]
MRALPGLSRSPSASTRAADSFVITGAAAPTAAAALEMIAAGLANWLRVPIELTL